MGIKISRLALASSNVRPLAIKDAYDLSVTPPGFKADFDEAFVYFAREPRQHQKALRAKHALLGEQLPRISVVNKRPWSFIDEANEDDGMLLEIHDLIATVRRQSKRGIFLKLICGDGNEFIVNPETIIYVR